MQLDIHLKFPIELRATFEIRGFTALLGRSGAGKTCLLKALAGILPASGTPWDGLPPEARQVGYLPQSAGLFPHLTALENTAYALRGRDRFQRASALLDELGLSDLAHHPAPALSGGQAQRVALARALARPAKLMLLDEPTAALDAAARDTTLDWLITTLATRQIPALAATHDPAIASAADWLALLSNRKIIQQGPVGDAPQSAAAAELLGYENIWQEGAQGFAIRAADIEIAETGIPATVISWRHNRVECAAPQRLTVRSTTIRTPGEIIHLRFKALKQFFF